MHFKQKKSRSNPPREQRDYLRAKRALAKVLVDPSARLPYDSFLKKGVKASRLRASTKNDWRELHFLSWEGKLQLREKMNFAFTNQNLSRWAKKFWRIFVLLVCVGILYVLSIGPMAVWHCRVYEPAALTGLSEEAQYWRSAFYTAFYDPLIRLIFWEAETFNTQAIYDFLMEYVGW